MYRKPKLSKEDIANYEWFVTRWEILRPVLYSRTLNDAWDMLYSFADTIFSSRGFSFDPFVKWRQEAVHHSLFISRRIVSINPRCEVVDLTNGIRDEIMRRQPEVWNDATMQGYFESFGILASHLPEAERVSYLQEIESQWNAAEETRILIGRQTEEKAFEKDLRLSYANFVTNHLTSQRYQVINRDTEAMRLEIIIRGETDLLPVREATLAEVDRHDTWKRIGDWFSRNETGSPQGFRIFLEQQERQRLSYPYIKSYSLEVIDMVDSIALKYCV